MKKLIVKLLAGGLTACILIVCINAWFVKLNPDSGDGTAKFGEVPSGIQISNVGSSHGLCDFYYTDIIDQYTCFNFGLTAQSLSYDYRIISYYEDNFAEDGIMFIPVSYFSFFGIEETQRDEFESQNQRYYKFLPPDKIKSYDYKMDLFVKRLPVLIQYDRLLEIMAEEFGKLKASPMVVAAQETGETLAEIQALDAEMLKSAEDSFRRHIERHMDESGNMIVNQEEIDALYDIIDFCSGKRIRPILITTPYTMEYNWTVEEKKPEFLDEFHGMIEEIQKNTGVAYYDYSADARFSENHQLFRDADHLNPDGAVKFVDILIDEVVND